MSCSDVPAWYLRHRLPVLDLRSSAWGKARAELLTPGYMPSTCVARLLKAGRIRRIAHGRYLVLDPVRGTPPIAVASALFADVSHYITTDAALAFHGSIDQPTPMITVVQAGRRSPVAIGRSVVRSVTVKQATLTRADAYDTNVESFKVRVATRVQAVVDALAEPNWMTHGSLLPEVLLSVDGRELADIATGARGRSTAAAQRLGYLLEEADRPIPASLAAVKPVAAVDLVPGQRTGTFSTRWRVYG